MIGESDSSRQQQWHLVVRRSFGISDVVANEDARKTLIEVFQAELEQSGWQNPTRGMSEPLLDALLALGTRSDLDDRLLSAEMGRNDASGLIDKGLAEIDPLHLVYDMRFEYPPEVVAAAQQVLNRVFQYVRENPFVD
jgi:hypothetical protein